jgi:hypothetical protein
MLLGFGSELNQALCGDAKRARTMKHTTNPLGMPNRTLSNINQISSWYDNDGIQEQNTQTGNAGLTYPRGTATAVFSAGLMWGGLFNDGQSPTVRVNGQSYNSGTRPGAILGIRTGLTEDPDAPDVRIWRIRRDFNTADLTLDAAEIYSLPPEEVPDSLIQAVRNQYLTDWLEWPAHKGAPFYDSDDDGVYTPEVVNGDPVLYPEADEPGVADGDQVIWYVCNDIEGVQPWGGVDSGIEQQTTIWGYDRTDALGHTIFKRFRLIYKGTASIPANATIDSMYIAQWSDPDLGIYTDDFAGCDTVLSLGYDYNGDSIDATYAQYGLAPPSLGYDLLQGPIVTTGNPSDTAIFNFQKIPSAKNLPMTAFEYCAVIMGGKGCYPPFSYQGTLQWYCMMQGHPATPAPPPCAPPFTDPYTGEPAGPFWLYGASDGQSAPNLSNPNGWVDGIIEGPGDRHIFLSSGPFSMAVGDTQEIVVAVVGGTGTSYLNSVVVLKSNDREVQTFWNDLNGITTDVSDERNPYPEAFALMQNYPNPFNPTTRIEFSLPYAGFVTLDVIDMLGRKVTTLISKKLTAGTHAVGWNAIGAASGVYLYRLTAGEFSQTRKLVLLR